MNKAYLFQMETNNNDGSEMEIDPPRGNIPLDQEKVTPDTHKIKKSAVKIWSIGDSHLREKHHFPELYGKARLERRTDERFGPLERRHSWDEGKPIDDDGTTFSKGYYLDDQFKDQVLDLVESSRGKATAVLLSVGSNDTRQQIGGKDVEKLAGKFEEIMKKVQETPGVALYILEPIPDRSGDQTSRNHLDRLLGETASRYKKTQYVSLTHGEAALIPKTQRAQLMAEELHLNRQGAERLVEAVIRATRKTPSEHFLVDPDAREARNRPRFKPPPVIRGRPRSRPTTRRTEERRPQEDLRNIIQGRVDKNRPPTERQREEPQQEPRPSGSGSGRSRRPTPPPPPAWPDRTADKGQRGPSRERSPPLARPSGPHAQVRSRSPGDLYYADIRQRLQAKRRRDIDSIERQFREDMREVDLCERDGMYCRDVDDDDESTGSGYQSHHP